MFREEIHSLGDLPRVARKFIEAYRDRRIFLLYGEMGAGKTTFVKEVCRVLGVEDVTSPTFSLVNEYKATDGRRIFHLDLYRIKSLAELLDIGIEEYLQSDATLLIEWPERVERLVAESVKVKIEVLGAGRLVEAD